MKKQKSSTQPIVKMPHKKAMKPKTPSRRVVWPWAIIRVAAICLIVFVGVGRYAAWKEAKEQARALESELAKGQVYEEELQAELDRFADPKWRESYWKWRTMSHEPGEYYIRFNDQP
jgi:hypothetical protein